ncbi:family 16 glycosylhydrolase [Phenylobacterium soli]|uniref:1,3-beta-glucanase n=1 Tax=Phenylobacterium soli TaxID=2170551 RepID=A0A328AM09_9CAUL|nr:family 16 glycosylhydrolase [Phenylobacterium soli]RAK55587.1 1,3-beta-glucanase [Phenylobacterium soli]
MSYLKYDGSAAVVTSTPVSNFYGTDAAETQTGTSAAEGFWGKAGDVLVGGAGDDTYYLQDKTAQVVEQPGAGTDMLVAWRNASLADHANIENLKIDGDGIFGAGDAHDNIIYAGSGKEQLYGGGGQDVMVAGTGQDTFIVKAGEGSDAIYGFKSATDVVRLTAGFQTFSDVQTHMTQVGADTKIDLGGGEGLVLRGVQATSLTSANFQLQLDGSKLGGMTFHDEFSAPLSVWNATYNPTGVWRPDYGYQGANGVGSYTLTGNGEQQIYTSPYFRDHNGDFSESPFTSNADGTLSITARPSTNSELFGYSYTSGMISTKQSFAQTYGYFEMKAELPQSAGGWPAFWLVPADGSWPPELDVMETLTNDPHADWTTEHSGVGGVHTSNGISSYIPDTADGFHTYGVLWTKTDLTWYVDGVQVFHTATPADMNKPMYMIANLALGGWGGSIDNSAMPETMKIDYIRSYGLADGSTTVQGREAITGGGAAYVAPTTGTATTGSTASTGSTSTSTTPSSSTTTATSSSTTTSTGGAATTTVSPPPPSPTPVDPSAGQNLTSHGYGDVLTGGSGADTLTSNQGGETMTGGAGADVFVFNTTPWSATHITDFQVGVDRLDVAKLYLDGYTGSDPVADGYVRFASDGHGGTAVIVDPDGRASGHQWGDYVVDLEHVDPATLTAAKVFGGQTVASTPVSTSTPSSTTATSTPTTSVTAPVTAPATVTGQVLTASGYGATLTGGAGADTLTAGNGGETLTGGAGADTFVFSTTPWTATHVADFQVGVDKLDVSKLYIDGYKGADPVADGYVRFASDGNGGTAVIVDPDGRAAGHAWGDYVVDLEHVAPSSLTAAQVFGGQAPTSTTSTTTTQPTAPTAPAGVVLTSSVAGDSLAGGQGADTLNASRGADTLTGGAGADHFVFAHEPWAPAHITDFTAGEDKIDLRGLFQGTGYAGTDPVADHYLTLIPDGNGGTAVLFDRDGAGSGQQWGDYVIDLEHVSPASLTAKDWIVG